MNPNLKRKLQNPFLRLRWRIKEKAKIRDAYYLAKSIKEIFIKKEECYKNLLKAERMQPKKEEDVYRLEGWIECLTWFFSE